MGNCFGQLEEQRRLSSTDEYSTGSSEPEFLFKGKLEYLRGEKLGEGSYGEVYACIQLPTFNDVALKILPEEYGKKEERILNMLGDNPKKKNLLPLIEAFTHKSYYCLVFDRLDVSISKYLTTTKQKPFSVSQLRVVAQQMLVALDALKSMGIVHTDIKPDNVMFVNCETHPLKITLIDFGLGKKVSEVDVTMDVQVIGYKAPEVLLGIPWDERIDMWALGCLLGRMYIGIKNIFPVHCPYEYIKGIVHMIGQPSDEMLQASTKRHHFFYDLERSDAPPAGSNGSRYRLYTQKEYMQASGESTHQGTSVYTKCDSIDDLPKVHPKSESELEDEDTLEFLSLLKCLLRIDQTKRIKPEMALCHSFITMHHLSTRKDDPYVVAACSNMQVCEDFKSLDCYCKTCKVRPKSRVR